MPLDSILRRKERIIKSLPTVTYPDARRLLAEGLQVSGVFDRATPEGTPVESASITLGETSIVNGTTTTATIAVLPEDATNKTGTWVSAIPARATINPTTGLITAVGNGIVSIIWVAGDGSGVTASTPLTVTAS